MKLKPKEKKKLDILSLRKMRVKKTKPFGYTLMELLIGIALVGILSGFIFSIYWHTSREYKRERVGIDRERELLNLQNYLRKLLGSIGFGISQEQLKNATVNCTDNNLSGFKNQTAVIGLAKNCSITRGPRHDRLYFRSLYTTGQEKAGCWWIYDPTGLKSMGVDKHNKPCDFNNYDRCRFMTFTKILLKDNENCNSTSSICQSSGGSCLVFYYHNPHNSETNDPPEVFRLHLDSFESDDISQKQRCAPKSAKLMLQREWNTRTYPLFDCVGGMTFVPLFKQGENLPYALRICLLIQVSGYTNSERELPTSPNCNFYLPDKETLNKWKKYRWRLIEEVIPLENLKM